jgi:hypothetical protein
VDLDLTGYTLQYESSTGSTSKVLTTFVGTLASGGFLVCGGYGFVGPSNCVIGNGLVTSGDIAASAGGLALVDPTNSYLASSLGYGAAASNDFVNNAPATWSSSSSYRALVAFPDGQYSGDDSVDFLRTTTLTPGGPNILTAP